MLYKMKTLTPDNLLFYAWKFLREKENDLYILYINEQMNGEDSTETKELLDRTTKEKQEVEQLREYYISIHVKKA